jgi:hypothetical protein
MIRATIALLSVLFLVLWCNANFRSTLKVNILRYMKQTRAEEGISTIRYVKILLWDTLFGNKLIINFIWHLVLTALGNYYSILFDGLQ